MPTAGNGNVRQVDLFRVALYEIVYYKARNLVVLGIHIIHQFHLIFGPLAATVILPRWLHLF